MIQRTLKISKSRSFFLFGARGTGKSTLIANDPTFNRNCLKIDMLEPDQEEKYSLRPQLLFEELAENPEGYKWVVIDEVQKSPKLLDVVHKLIESTNIKFALTGSSSRKLKRMGANLLAGRAFRYFLYPQTSVEQGKKMNLEAQLKENYIKEEVVAEQAVRNLTPLSIVFADLHAE